MNAVAIAIAAGTGVLLTAQHAVHSVIRLRTIEVTAIAAAAGALVGLALTQPPERAVLLLPLAVLGCAAAVVDAHEGRLPDVLTWPLMATTMLCALTTAAGNSGINVCVVSLAVGGLVAVIMKLAAGAGFGWGDAKLVPSLAVVLVRGDAVGTGVVSVVVLVAVTAVIAGFRDRGTLVPYGPAMVIGTVGAVAL